MAKKGKKHDSSRDRHNLESGSDVIKRGGKVDPDALRRRMLLDNAAEADESSNVERETADASSGGEAVGAGVDDEAPIAAPVGVDDDSPNRVVFALQRDLNKRLDKYLTDRIPFMSRSQLQRLIDNDGVKVNSRSPKASTVLRKGDVVEVFVPPPPSSEVVPEDIALDVLYEDDYLIVLNKQADIIVHPARSHLAGTMINALAYHFRNRSPRGGTLSAVGKEFARPGVVHRLDRNTTGVIVFAKDDEAHWKLGSQFEHRRVDKRYVAIVHGHVEPPIDVIELPIGPHPSKEKGYREKYVVRHDELGRPSTTICRVLARLEAKGITVGVGDTPADGGTGGGFGGKFSIVELELKTGRTHQIRVHLSYLGWPIVGDDMYGGRAVSVSPPNRTRASPGTDETIFARQALHAAMLSFTHPITNEKMMFTAPLPRDLRELVESLRNVGGIEILDPPGRVLSIERLVEHHTDEPRP